MLNKSKRKAQMVILATFLLGAFSGGLATYIVQHQQAKNSNTVATIVDAVDQRISLQPEQRSQVETIITDMQSEYRKLKENTRPQYDAIRQQTREKIRNLLTDAQRQPYEQYLQELDAKREMKRQAENASK